MLALQTLTAWAQQDSLYVHDSKHPFIVISPDTVNVAPTFTDAEFYDLSTTVTFVVGKTSIREDDPFFDLYRQAILPNINSKHLQLRRVIVRGAASPEGSYQLNQRLARGRSDALITELLRNMPFQYMKVDRQVSNVTEDYGYLCLLMQRNGDSDYQVVKDIYDRAQGNEQQCKREFMAAQGGRLWQRLLKEYFPQLRAARLMLWFSKPDAEHAPVEPLIKGRAATWPITADMSVAYRQLPPMPRVEVEPEEMLRREVLSVKTNLLEYGAPIPDYGWCPMPNVAVEYFPRHGHFTFGASLDFPWWIGNTTNHHYFELRNYQLETRYYTRNSNRSYEQRADGSLTQRSNGQAAFKGFYLSAYAHAFLYQIGLTARKGWIGEGAGGGLGLGYVFPLSRNQHWRMEVGAQVGVFVTRYDPFRYGCPVEDTVEDGLYYYDYTGDPDLFKERQYRFTWLGPTRVSLTLSYDLMYRRITKRGVSFKHREKGGRR